MKPWNETKVGKFLSGKGVDIVLDAAKIIGIPGASIFDAVKDQVLKSDKLTPHDKETALMFLQLDQKDFEIEAQDRADARSREIEMAHAGRKDTVMSIVVFIGIGLWVACVAISAFYPVPDANKEFFQEFSLTVRDIAFMIFAYYVGASKGGRDASKALLTKATK